jgi:hypothetical protein
MDHKLRLTARGLAICELMLDHGLTLEAACRRIDDQLDALHHSLERIIQDDRWDDVTTAVRTALAGVSAHVRSAYLEEREERPEPPLRASFRA